MSDTTQSEEAAMYRWLRDRHQWFVNTGGNPSPWVFIGRDGVVDGSPCTGPELDAAIRQAMADDAAGVAPPAPAAADDGVRVCCVTHSRCPDVGPGNVCKLRVGLCDGQRTPGVREGGKP